jgi:hypothetical protein
MYLAPLTGWEAFVPDLRDICNSFGLLLRPVFGIRVPSFARLISLPTIGLCGLATIGRVEALEQKETCIWLTYIFPKAFRGFVARC